MVWLSFFRKLLYVFVSLFVSFDLSNVFTGFFAICFAFVLVICLFNIFREVSRLDI